MLNFSGLLSTSQKANKEIAAIESRKTSAGNSKKASRNNLFGVTILQRKNRLQLAQKTQGTLTTKSNDCLDQHTGR